LDLIFNKESQLGEFVHGPPFTQYKSDSLDMTLIIQQRSLLMSELYSSMAFEKSAVLRLVLPTTEELKQ
jgi:hypothetical protein